MYVRIEVNSVCVKKEKKNKNDYNYNDKHQHCVTPLCEMKKQFAKDELFPPSTPPLPLPPPNYKQTQNDYLLFEKENRIRKSYEFKNQNNNPKIKNNETTVINNAYNAYNDNNKNNDNDNVVKYKNENQNQTYNHQQQQQQQQQHKYKHKNNHKPNSSITTVASTNSTNHSKSASNSPQSPQTIQPQSTQTQTQTQKQTQIRGCSTVEYRGKFIVETPFNYDRLFVLFFQTNTRKGTKTEIKRIYKK